MKNTLTKAQSAKLLRMARAAAPGFAIVPEPDHDGDVPITAFIIPEGPGAEKAEDAITQSLVQHCLKHDWPATFVVLVEPASHAAPAPAVPSRSRRQATRR